MGEQTQRSYRLRQDRILELMKERRLSQKKLADLVEVTTKTLRAWLNGATAYQRNIEALAAVLRTDINGLIEGASENASPAGPMSASVTVQCSTSKEFIEASKTLAEAYEMIENQRRFGDRKVRIYYVPATQQETGLQGYFYVMVSAILHNKFMEAMDLGIIPDFSIIVYSGAGEPDTGVKNYIKHTYGFDHDAIASKRQMVSNEIRLDRNNQVEDGLWNRLVFATEQSSIFDSVKNRES